MAGGGGGVITRSDQSRLQPVILYLSNNPSYRSTHHRVSSTVFSHLARASSTFPAHLARALSTFTIHLARAFLAFPPLRFSRARARHSPYHSRGYPPHCWPPTPFRGFRQPRSATRALAHRSGCRAVYTDLWQVEHSRCAPPTHCIAQSHNDRRRWQVLASRKATQGGL